MSDVSDTAIVRLLIADYASIDAVGKLNVVGGGLSVIGQPDQPGIGMPSGFTAPFGLVISVAVAPALYGSECALEVALEDSKGELVELAGPAGQPQKMRIAQNSRFDEPNVVFAWMPRSSLRARIQWVLMFSGGLPLPIGQRYVWRVRIDGSTSDHWTEEFFVPGPPPGPVIG